MLGDRRLSLPRPKNGLLAALPDEDFRRLRPALKTVPLCARQVLQRQREDIRYVYFPNDGVASVTTVFADGAMVEVALVGREGMLGIEALFTDHPVAAGERVIQVVNAASDAEQLTVEDFRREYGRRGALQDVVGQYAQAALTEIVQTAGCNAVHPVRKRCARWLLMTHDRIRRPEFNLSHDLLAVMLGVSRPTVSEVAAVLQHEGLIQYSHGHLKVLDRKALEGAACECYMAIHAAFEKLTERGRSVA